MKKKLLSLVLAGAMVASTSVSAFAAVIEDQDTTEPTPEIKITGQVANDKGDLPVGRFNITIPTTASFTITKDGKFVTPGTIKVQNDGEQKIEVYAYKFTDSTPVDKKGITAVGKDKLTELNRAGVNLSITGNEVKAYLGSVNSGNGIYSDENLKTQAPASDGIKIATVSKMNSQNLTLDGEVGKKTSRDGEEGVINEAIKDTFTLTLKIKKSTENSAGNSAGNSVGDSTEDSASQ